MSERIDVLGVGFDPVTVSQAADRAMEAVRAGEPGHWVVTPNPEIVWDCKKNPDVMEAVNRAFLVLPDGIGIVLGAKILGRPLPGKAGGCDFGLELCRRLGQEGKRLFLLGAKPGVAEKAAETLKAEAPGLVIAGCADGYFSEDAPVVEKINAAAPDALFVCLGAPKQERWMAKNAPDLQVPLMAGIGGSLDVWAGAVKRAPDWWIRHNLEWLYRLIKEPRRIRRQIRLPLFLLAVIWQRIRGK